MTAKLKNQHGFSLVEVVSAIVILAILATGFLSAFSVVLKNSASPLQIGLMEEIAATQLDKVLSGTFQSAVAVPASATVNIDGTNFYTAFSSVPVASVPSSAVHVTVSVSCNGCTPGPSLSGDVYDIR